MQRIKAPTAALSSVDRFREGIGQGDLYLVGGELGKTGFEIDDDVIRRRPSVSVSVVFANHPARAISLYRAADPRRGRNSNPPPSLGGDDRHADDAGCTATAILHDGPKLLALQNPSISTESRGGGRPGPAIRASERGRLQAPRRWRPLARRRLMTSLPPRDLIRTRNP